MKYEFTIPGNPRSKGRARKGQGKVFTPKETVVYERNVGLVGLVNRPRGWPMDAEYSVSVVAYYGDRIRRDIDNIAKSILDGLNGVSWDDDWRIVELFIRRDYDKAQPRVEVIVTIYESESP